MRHVLLDTHAWAWTLTGDSRLSASASRAIENADSVAVSVVSLFEIGQKIRLGKWPEMAPFVNRLIPMAREQGGRLLALTAEASLLASSLNWAHRDPFDRFLGATAIMEGLSLVSADLCFDSLSGQPGWTNRIW